MDVTETRPNKVCVNMRLACMILVMSGLTLQLTLFRVLLYSLIHTRQMRDEWTEEDGFRQYFIPRQNFHR